MLHFVHDMYRTTRKYLAKLSQQLSLTPAAVSNAYFFSGIAEVSMVEAVRHCV